MCVFTIFKMSLGVSCDILYRLKSENRKNNVKLNAMSLIEIEQ